MSNAFKPLICAMTVTLASLAIPPSVSAQGGDLAAIGEQMGKSVGAMNTIAGLCGDATDSELAMLKQKQRAQHQQSGMDAASFDRGFSSGEQQVQQKWQTLSASERTNACVEVKQQFEEMARQLGQTYGQ
ncbi:hypothetical protein H4F99_09390 [Lysobacter sp. SG-8]|uniref:DUF1311 domain-containing protein n=1 Tax=Marilutibacter penaei TaxID=2759900 RepID=A0A7W3U4H0_9GAMM|nr:hypothetical protein [Lysobacter penaei]MBB1088702.1 hypothetical protein [Lysobacter penaei]